MAGSKDSKAVSGKRNPVKKKMPGLTDEQLAAGYRGFKPKFARLEERKIENDKVAHLPEVKSSLGSVDNVRAAGVNATARKGVRYSK